MVAIVHLQKEVSGKTLEQACIDAAEKLGYNTESQDDFIDEYKLGSISKHKKYKETIIRIGDFVSPLLVKEINKNSIQDSFYISPGSAPENIVQKYLSAVSEYLKEHQK